MKYIIKISAAICLLLGEHVFAQQTPIYSDYYYNQVIVNPAHAGYYPDTEVSLSNFGYFNQFEGSPRTFSGIFNTNFLDQKVGIAGGFISDEIGVTSATTVFASYAYKIDFGNNYNRARWWDYNPDVLSFGLTTGVTFFNENLSELNIQGDPNFENDINVTVPTFGFGALYNHNRLYVGFAVQNLFSNATTDQNLPIDVPYYVYGGYRFYTSKFGEYRIQPSVLAKFVSGAPTQFDFNVSVNYKNKIEIGGGYRTQSSFNALAGLYIWDKWRIAYSYTSFTNDLPFSNTHGILLTYRAGEGFRVN